MVRRRRLKRLIKELQHAVEHLIWNGKVYNETCSFLVGDRTLDLVYAETHELNEGNPVHVDFEDFWEFGLSYARSNRLVGFYHTHPFANSESGLLPSGTDIRTMQGWVKATGLDLACIISNGDGVVKNWWFYGYDVETERGKITQVSYMELTKFTPIITQGKMNACLLTFPGKDDQVYGSTKA